MDFAAAWGELSRQGGAGQLPEAYFELARQVLTQDEPDLTLGAFTLGRIVDGQLDIGQPAEALRWARRAWGELPYPPQDLDSYPPLALGHTAVLLAAEAQAWLDLHLAVEAMEPARLAVQHAEGHQHPLEKYNRNAMGYARRTEAEVAQALGRNRLARDITARILAREQAYLDKVPPPGGLQEGERPLEGGLLDNDRRRLQLVLLAAEFEVRGRPGDEDDWERRVRAAAEPLLASELTEVPELVSTHARLGQLEFALGNVQAAEAAIEQALGTQGEELLPATQAQLDGMRARLAELRGEDLVEPRRVLRASIARVLEGWKARGRLEGGHAYLHYGRMRFAVEQLLACDLILEEPDALLADLMAVHGIGGLHGTLGVTVAGASEVRAAFLGEGSGLLIFVAGKDRCRVVALDAERCTDVALGPYDALSSQIRAWRRELGDDGALRGSAELQALRAETLEQGAQALRAELLPPAILDQVLGWSRIGLLGREALHSLELEALPLPDGRPLGLTLPLQELPSLGVALHLAGPRAASPALSWGGVIAPPGRGAELESYDVEGLRRSITEAWSEDAYVLRTGADASRTGLAEVLAARPFGIDIIGHGVRSAGGASPMAILLAAEGESDGRLGAGDILPLPMCELVLLGACESRSGVIRLGDVGATDLVAALLGAGARAVLAAEHKLYDQPYSVFRAALFRALEAGERLDSSVLAARQAVAGGGFADPAYWATISLVGHGGLRLPGAR